MGVWHSLKMWLVAFGLVAGALAASWFGGRKTAQADIKVQKAESYAKTRRRMDETHMGDDPSVLREWLRERSKRDGNM